jgi:segregation and condensation protein A
MWVILACCAESKAQFHSRCQLKFARRTFPSHKHVVSPTTPSVDATDYKVRLEIFEGPLDLLLYLIKKDEVDIQAISIERITRQYLDYLNTFKLLNIDLASEFIVMAANLMYLKSRTLLPRVDQPPDDDAEDDDPRWDLIRQLIEYKKFKDAAGFLSLRAIEQEGRFAHQPDTPEKPAAEPAPLAEVSIFDLIRAFQNVLKRFEQSHDFGDIIDDRFTVSDKIDFLLGNFAPGEAKSFDTLFQSATTKAEVIVTFLALLELMKLNQFIVRQSTLLGSIAIERRTHHAIAELLAVVTDA